MRTMLINLFHLIRDALNRGGSDDDMNQGGYDEPVGLIGPVEASRRVC